MSTECEHCDHATGLVYTTYPAQDEYICCKCGRKRAERRSESSSYTDEPSKHGPFLPTITTYYRK